MSHLQDDCKAERRTTEHGRRRKKSHAKTSPITGRESPDSKLWTVPARKPESMSQPIPRKTRSETTPLQKARLQQEDNARPQNAGTILGYMRKFSSQLISSMAQIGSPTVSGAPANPNMERRKRPMEPSPCDKSPPQKETRTCQTDRKCSKRRRTAFPIRNPQGEVVDLCDSGDDTEEDSIIPSSGRVQVSGSVSPGDSSRIPVTKTLENSVSKASNATFTQTKSQRQQATIPVGKKSSPWIPMKNQSDSYTDPINTSTRHTMDDEIEVSERSLLAEGKLHLRSKLAAITSRSDSLTPKNQKSLSFNGMNNNSYSVTSYNLIEPSHKQPHHMDSEEASDMDFSKSSHKDESRRNKEDPQKEKFYGKSYIAEQSFNQRQRPAVGQKSGLGITKANARSESRSRNPCGRVPDTPDFYGKDSRKKDTVENISAPIEQSAVEDARFRRQNGITKNCQDLSSKVEDLEDRRVKSKRSHVEENKHQHISTTQMDKGANDSNVSKTNLLQSRYGVAVPVISIRDKADGKHEINEAVYRKDQMASDKRTGGSSSVINQQLESVKKWSMIAASPIPSRLAIPEDAEDGQKSFSSMQQSPDHPPNSPRLSRPLLRLSCDDLLLNSHVKPFSADVSSRATRAIADSVENDESCCSFEEDVKQSTHNQDLTETSPSKKMEPMMVPSKLTTGRLISRKCITSNWFWCARAGHLTILSQIKHRH